MMQTQAVENKQSKQVSVDCLAGY